MASLGSIDVRYMQSGLHQDLSSAKGGRYKHDWILPLSLNGNASNKNKKLLIYVEVELTSYTSQFTMYKAKAQGCSLKSRSHEESQAADKQRRPWRAAPNQCRPTPAPFSPQPRTSPNGTR